MICNNDDVAIWYIRTMHVNGFISINASTLTKPNNVLIFLFN